VTTVDTVLSKHDNGLNFSPWFPTQNQTWKGSLESISFDQQTIKNKLMVLDKPCYVVKVAGKIGVTNEGYLSPTENGTTAQVDLLTFVPPVRIQQLGDPNFLSVQWLAELLPKKW
jgi:trans-AT polyketide synthase, acyltransferase and oxidoreductase domains